MKIYTKSGDQGTTGMYGGKRLSKSDLRIEAIGEVDELNSCIGSVLSLAPEMNRLVQTQSWLFDIGSELAMPDAGTGATWIGTAPAKSLEVDMDKMTASLEPLRTFILPGGTELAARLHLARSVCRRAERAVVRLAESESVRNEPIVFLNRLSDWLFTAARFANHKLGVSDVTWQKTVDLGEEG